MIHNSLLQNQLHFFFPFNKFISLNSSLRPSFVSLILFDISSFMKSTTIYPCHYYVARLLIHPPFYYIFCLFTKSVFSNCWNSSSSQVTKIQTYYMFTIFLPLPSIDKNTLSSSISFCIKLILKSHSKKSLKGLERTF